MMTTQPYQQQWSVDPGGMEYLPDGRFYPAPFCLELRTVNGQDFYDLPLHVAGKLHIEMSVFWAAFRAFLLQSGRPIDPVIWDATSKEAERIEAAERAEQAEWDRQFSADPMGQFTPRTIQELRAEKVPGKP